MSEKAVSITHLGGETCVTGSCHLVQGAGFTIMVDCGMAQGHDPLLSMAEWPVKPADIDYLFLTHSHIDHIGDAHLFAGNGRIPHPRHRAHASPDPQPVPLAS